jgi:cytochrome c oxidase subunit 4
MADNHNHDHDHTHAHKSHMTEYIVIFFILSILTGVELMIPGLNTLYVYKAASLISLAAGKACIVAYFYMHLKEETAWLKLIAAVPISAVLFAVVLILESNFR